MITKLRKGILHREVITSQGVGPYSRNLKVIYWIGCDRKGIMDTQWHDRTIEHTWAEARARHGGTGEAVYGRWMAGTEWTYHGRDACRYPGSQSRRCAEHSKNGKAAGRTSGQRWTDRAGKG